MTHRRTLEEEIKFLIKIWSDIIQIQLENDREREDLRKQHHLKMKVPNAIRKSGTSTNEKDDDELDSIFLATSLPYKMVESSSALTSCVSADVPITENTSPLVSS